VHDMSQANQIHVLAELGGVFTFTVSNVRQFCLTLTQNAFADNVIGIRGTASNSLSADRRVRVGWYS